MASILVIDDSAYMRAKVRDTMKLDGHRVLEAGDGLSGLRMVYEHKPDCIILDLIMPELDGLKILRTLHERGVGIPVVVVTADIQVSVQKQCLALGAVAFLNKPLQERELLHTVREVLSIQHKGVAVRPATPYQIDTLKELFNIGVGRAAASLNDMVKSPVSLEVPFVRVLSPLQFKKETEDLGDTPMAAVKMEFEGPFCGTAALVIPPASAAKIVDVLTGPAAGAPGRDAGAEETLREVGNIVLNGVLGSVGNILKQHISYSLPAYAENSVKNLFFSSAIGNDTIFLLVRTRFFIRELEIEGNVILLFTVGAFDILLSAIDEMK